MDNEAVPNKPLRRWLRFTLPLQVRPRLSFSALMGLLAYVLLPHTLLPIARGLLAWDFGVLLFLALIFIFMMRADGDAIRRNARKHDEGRNAVLALAIGAAAVSVTAIATELASAKGQGARLELLHVLFSGTTILLSWAFVQMIFVLHYASVYYSVRHHGKAPYEGGLDFPGDEDPDYWDFVYFSVIIGATAQTADVAITSKAFRRIVTTHSLIAFAFNTAVLALMINLAAGLF